MTTVVSTVLAASIAAGFGTSAATAVEQGGTGPGDSAPEQGGTTPGQSAPEQGGTTPTPEPAPPANIPGPGSIPGPPQEAPYQPYTEQQSQPNYDDAYNPVPQAPLAPRKRAAPVRPIAPPENKIRVGNVVTPIPPGLSQRDVNSINAWSAYGEAKIAQNLISLGVPEDQASRQAAATIIGVMAGGSVGAVALGIPGAVAGGVAGAVAGVAIAVPLGPAGVPLAAISVPVGIAAGTAAGALAGAAVGGAIGGTIGGLSAYTLGAGDPGAHPKTPWEKDNRPTRPEPRTPNTPKHAPKTSANQFEVRLPGAQASRVGLPAVDYVVDVRGDVTGRIGGQKFGWSGEQANAAYAVLGQGAQGAARQLTKQGAAQLQAAIPGISVTWPQEVGR